MPRKPVSRKPEPRKSVPAAAVVALSTVLFALPALAQGDAAAGKKVFRKCAACHTVDAGNRVGPSLAGIVGRAVASVEGFRYSPAMQEFAADGKAWDEARLAEYVAAPKAMVKGTSMAFAGIRKDQEIADLIAYLRDPAAAP